MKQFLRILGIELILLTTFFNLFGQNNDDQKVNAFRYSIILPMQYERYGKTDRYGVLAELGRLLYERGFKVMYDSGGMTPPGDFILNTQQILSWNCYHSNYELEVDARDLKNNKIFYKKIQFDKSTKVFRESESNEYSLKLINALNKALKPLTKYKFDESLSLKLYPLPKVEITQETEESVKKYLRENEIDQIEGIYKSIDNKGAFYKIGVKKRDDKFIAIVIETTSPHWTSGEVKAYFEKVSTSNVYSTSFWMANKERVECLAELNDLILTINRRSPRTNENVKFAEFIKVFP